MALCGSVADLRWEGWHHESANAGPGHGLDVGATTPMLWCFRDREEILDMLEELCGSRMNFNYYRPGGVLYDFPPGWVSKLSRFLDRYEKNIEADYVTILDQNEIFLDRTTFYAESGGQVVEQATHLYDAARFLVGEGEVVAATSARAARAGFPDADVDAQLVRTYFDFTRVRQGLLDVTGRLFGVRYQPVDVPVWHEDVQYFDVVDVSDRRSGDSSGGNFVVPDR